MRRLGYARAMRRSRGTLVVGALLVACACACGSMMVACSSDDAGDAPRDGGVDAWAQSDAGAAIDGASDARDASIDDASIGDAVCAPSSDPYVPTWHPPHTRASLCTADDLETFWIACW